MVKSCLALSLSREPRAALALLSQLGLRADPTLPSCSQIKPTDLSSPHSWGNRTLRFVATSHRLTTSIERLPQPPPSDQ